MGVGKEDERFVPPPEVHYNLGEKRRGREALKEQTQTRENSSSGKVYQGAGRYAMELEGKEVFS